MHEKELMRTYKFRLYPTRQQDGVMVETLETCRRLYNELLGDRICNHTNVFAQKRAVSRSRTQNKYLKQVYSQVVQDVALRLDKAFGSFFAGISKHPRFKRKGRYSSFTYPQYGNHGGFLIVDKKVRLSMIGKVRIRLHREIVGTPKTCTVIKDVDHWYACIIVKSEGENALIIEKPPVGVDLGISSALTLSDGTTIPPPNYLKKSEVELRTLQKSLARKKEGSKNQVKAKLKLARRWRTVRNRRNDFAHKASHFLADNYGAVFFEDLRIKNMVRNHTLASAILDACWGKLRQLTAYKAEGRGGREILVEPRGTSQECSGCGKIVQKDLSVRVHLCPACGLELDRDVNAARNILARGLEQAPVEAEPLPVIRIGKFGRGSKKPTSLRSG